MGKSGTNTYRCGNTITSAAQGAIQMNTKTITTAIIILALAAAVAFSKHPLVQVGNVTVQDSFKPVVVVH